MYASIKELSLVKLISDKKRIQKTDTATLVITPLKINTAVPSDLGGWVFERKRRDILFTVLPPTSFTVNLCKFLPNIPGYYLES